MIDLGRELPYNDLQKLISSQIDKENNFFISELAGKLEINRRTIYNFFNYSEQIVSDKLFTKISGELGFSIKIVWENGKKKYFVLD